MTEQKTESNAVAFHTTRWTRVMLARGDSEESRKALSELCEIYYAPVRAFIGHTTGNDDADDLAQAFFSRLIERAGLESVDPQRGRFRSYLLGAVKHYIRDEWVKSQAEKRGGGNAHLRLGNVDSELSEASPPDTFFDREWALALIGRALTAVEVEQPSTTTFEVLKPWLNKDSVDLTQADAARQLDISEGAVKVAIHRLRKQFRQCVREEIGQTVANQEDVAAELRYLIEVLASGEQ